MNCLRRFPPVECIGLPDAKNQKSARPPSSDEAELIAFETTAHDTNGGVILSRRKPLVAIGAPTVFAGRVTATNTMNGAAIEPTSENAELLHFCKSTLCYLPQIITNINPQFRNMSCLAMFPLMAKIFHRCF